VALGAFTRQIWWHPGRISLDRFDVFDFPSGEFFLKPVVYDYFDKEYILISREYQLHPASATV
jgi:hypothetical protein